MSATESWWNLVLSSIEAEHWPVAEGALLRMIDSHGPHPDLLDLLGYALLMQGQCIRCEAVMRQAIELGTKNFWSPHKLGDALRAQQRLAEAAPAYEQALSWGSDSPLTVRNLLEVLHRLNHRQALERLEAFASSGHSSPADHQQTSHADWSEPMPWQLGAIEASRNIASREMAFWLCQHGCPDPGVRRLVWQEALLTLQISTGLDVLADQDDTQAVALKHRLDALFFPPAMG